MTLLELVATLREQLDDQGGSTGSPPAGYTYYWEYDDSGCLWSNRELTEYLNAACEEFALRYPIHDSQPSILTRITLTVGKAVYPIDRRILAIDRVTLASLNNDSIYYDQPLRKFSQADEWNYWDDRQARQPGEGIVGYREDFNERLLTVYPAPTVVDTLQLAIRRLPLEPLTWGIGTSSESPEFPESWHRSLLNWVKALAYRKDDTDTRNQDLSTFYQGQFANEVGPRIDFVTQRVVKDLSGKRQRTRAQYY